MKRLTLIAVTLALLAALCIGTGACSDDSCYDNGSSLPLATFFVGATQQNITGLSVMGIGVPGDSLLLDSASVNEVYLPLRASVKTTAFAFSRWVTTGTGNTLMCDTITVDYEPIEYFHSIECGAMYNFDVKQVRNTTHAIDSVVLLNNLITNSRTPALRIYFTDFKQ